MVEMVARTLKKMIHQSMAEQILGQAKRINDLHMRGEQNEAELHYLRHLDKEKEIQKLLTDFMNLVFGAGEESMEFWDSVIIRKTFAYYCA
jgi:hypothetical protein